jgi:methyltransferase (TIGR00027 family)
MQWRQRMARRTAFFDRASLAALERGVRQVVVLGAGYDGRALRFATPGVTWFEVDHPATQSDKRARLAALGARTDGIAHASLVQQRSLPKDAHGHSAGCAGNELVSLVRRSDA